MTLKRNSKGYTVIQWALLLGVVIGLWTLSQRRLTNALESKMVNTAAYVLWTSWGDTADFTAADDYDNRRSITKSIEIKRLVRHENHAGEIRTFIDPTVSQIRTKNMSTSVSDDMVGEGLDTEFLDKVPIEVEDP